MLGLIYINIIKEVNFDFNQTLLTKIKEAGQYEVYEMDNFSEPLIFQYVHDFIDAHNKIILVLNIKGEGKQLKILPIINKLIKKEEVSVYLLNKHEMIEKMIKPFKQVHCFDDEGLLFEKLYSSVG